MKSWLPLAVRNGFLGLLAGLLAVGVFFFASWLLTQIDQAPPSSRAAVEPDTPAAELPAAGPQRQTTAGPFRLTATEPSSGPVSALPAARVKLAAAIPRHYAHIRLAALAYKGNSMGPFEDDLLKQSIDLVVPHKDYLEHIHAVAPQTPQLIYTNTSSLYQHLLLSWLQFADEQQLSREDAFYHAKQATRFSGDSPSSKPVNWFWGVYRGGRTLSDHTAVSHAKKSSGIRFGQQGEALYIGFPERFREINVQLSSPARKGWSSTLEYVSAADGGWGELTVLADSTAKLSQRGRITFDPPADWKPATIAGTPRLYYVRFRTVESGDAPVAARLLGRDYVEAGETTAGTIPAFDAAADANGDGYLNDEEYAQCAAGKNARFLYETRVFDKKYGQMRFAVNPASAGFRRWAVAHHVKYLEDYPLAGGLFMDNALGVPAVHAADVQEPVAGFAEASGSMIGAIAEAIAPRLILLNVGGDGLRSAPILRANPLYFEEFGLRPLAHHYQTFEQLAKVLGRRAELTEPPPYAVLDSHAHGGSPTDPRTQLATLAYYYLLADPETTFLMFFGGQEPATPWSRHWVPAAAFDVGKPTGKWSCWAKGNDPANVALEYRVYQRPYEKALMLYKPLSFGGWTGPQARLDDPTATKHDLDRAYRPLQADGQLGEPVRTLTLRNGEGAILVNTDHQ